MAHIHNARNELQEKLEQAIAQRKNKDLANSLDNRKERTRGIIGGAIFLALCVIGFILLLNNINIGLTVRAWVGEKLSTAAEYVMDSEWGGDWMQNLFGDSFFVALLDIVIYLILFIPKILVIILLIAMTIVMPSVVRITLYLLPLILGIVAIFILLFHIFWYDSEAPESDEEQIIRAGLEGEQAALDLMKKLNSNCHVFTNLRIPYDGGESETDLIVASPAGVTIIEVKNYKGTISGDASDDSLTQTKTGRRGGSSDKTVQNPIKQVGTHVYRVAGYLREQGIRTHVRCCVLFVSDEVTLNLTDYDEVTGEKCPVYTRDTIRELYDYVSSGKTVLNDVYFTRTVGALDGLVQKSFGREAPPLEPLPKPEPARRSTPTASKPKTTPLPKPVTADPVEPASDPHTPSLPASKKDDGQDYVPRRVFEEPSSISNEKFK